MLAVATVLLVGCSHAPAGGDGSGGGGGDDQAVPDAGITVEPAAWSADPACSAAVTAIYDAQPAGPRGSVLACALGEKLDTAGAQAAMAGDGAEGVTARTGVRVVKLAYRTVRSDGTAVVTTATAYLPLVPRALPAPIVLVGRSTSGIADTCAPSRETMPGKNLALPFAARGFVTITPDFSGLGNAGTHAYLDTHEEVAQLFDGALALRALLAPGTGGDPVAAVGYSQGGGIVLGAQALEHAMTGKRTLKAVAAIAPEWPISTRSFGYEDVLRNPDRITGLAGLSPPTVTVLRHYGFLINHLDESHGGDAFPASQASSIISSVESLCTVPLGGALGARQRYLRDLVDDTFRRQVLGCIDGTPACAGLGQQFHDWLVSDFVTADPQGARVLIAQGLGDQVMPAAGEAACDVAKLRAEGVEPDLCVDATATHDTVLERRIEDVVAWTEAVASGQAPVLACGSQSLPACSR